MPFELTEALIDDILFSMEDQGGNFFLDTREGVVAEMTPEFDGDPETEGERYISLPQWDSSSGFRLMERFTAALRNPLIREELSGALNRGKGVFRAFKNILGQYPEAEKLWFAFKEREMKREILRWYNGLREEWGLQRIGDEPEETGDLVLEDFRFRAGTAADEPAAAKLHRLCTGELRDAAAEKRTGFPAGDSPWVFPGDKSLVVETVGGEFAGYIAAAASDLSLHIYALEIRPEYRGLGIGEALITRLLDTIGADQKEQIRQLSIDLPVTAEGFSRVLLRESFKPCFMRYSRDWEDSEQ
ncbi:MAG: GNAT family N-acetyltransferase [Treponema sp.]|jgi:ribosomal protein S18 acetylase RimI-like enzyme|nr:GNAT family N-acetyltransferase [Treponema sp.]